MYKHHIWDEDKIDIHSSSGYAGHSSGSSGAGYAGHGSKDSQQDYHKNEIYTPGKRNKRRRRSCHLRIGASRSQGLGDRQSDAGGKRKLKAHISKNVGSFFAKASAGICTAQDVTLFEREDHFHINIVEDEQKVCGNIQAYIVEFPVGSRSLVLRGFNPNTAFLDKIDAGAFCEAVLKVAKQFQVTNGLVHVYITENLGGWHALSNREAVSQYLQRRYVKDKRERKFNLPITASNSVSNIYEIF